MVGEEKEPYLLYEIACLYYEEGLTQEEIAKHTGFSRSRVQRLLESARREGIVEIRLVSPSLSFATLERSLEERFTLQKAIVVYSSLRSDYLTRRRIALAAAKYLESILQEDNIIGIGWGRTVHETLRCFHRQTPLTVVPLVGATGQIEVDFQVNEVAHQFAKKVEGRFIPFYAPVLVDTEEIARTFSWDQNIRRVMDLWEELDVALVGAGDPRLQGAPVPQFFFNDLVVSQILKNKEVVGDLLCHFLKKDGTLNDPSFDRRVMSISLSQLKRIPQVVGVIGSVGKREILWAILRGGYVSVLVTDAETAKAVLEEERGEDEEEKNKN
ncbi:MAG: sugar-binding transcriptional regulator [Candidatus Caldatribacteriaceae bacterium]